MTAHRIRRRAPHRPRHRGAHRPRTRGERGEPAAEFAAFENEIRAERRYERGLAIKAAFVIALIAGLLVAHVYLFS
jgi:hypothetical protein